MYNSEIKTIELKTKGRNMSPKKYVVGNNDIKTIGINTKVKVKSLLRK